MRITFHRTIATLAGLVLMSACGGTAEPAQGSTGSAGASAPSAVPSAAPTAAASTAPTAAASAATSSGEQPASSPPAATSGSGAAASPAQDDRVVVALDDFAALNALSLGVTPDLVLEVFEYETTTAIFDDLGLTTQPYGSDLDLEQVIAAEPDVIIGVSLPTTLSKEADLASIAPTTILDYAGTWQEQMDAAAAALGRQDAATALQARLEGDLDALATDLASAGVTGTVVSVIGDNAGRFSPPPDTALGSLLAGAGLERPAAQLTANTPPFVSFSPETLRDHDAEVLYLLSGGAYATDGLEGSPLWPQLTAVTSDAVYEVNGETWLGSSAFSVDWVIRDLRATLLDDGAAAPGSDAPARFAEFLAS